MSAAGLRPPPRPFAVALRTTVAAGGWANLLLVLAMLAVPLMARLIGNDKGAYAGLVLAAMSVMFWTMVAGGCLVALCATAAAQRLPRWHRQAWRCGVAALAMAVLLPAALQAQGSPVGFGLAAAALAAGAALGLFFVSMPPWLMWVMIGMGMAARWLPGEVDGATLQAWLVSPRAVGVVALALLAACAACWAWLWARRDSLGPWSKPIALAITTASGTGIQAQQAAYASPMFMMDTPVGSDLRRAPQQALAIALGPGFGRSTARSLLATHGPVVAVALFWLLLGTGAGPGEKFHVGLTFAPLMVLSTALAPMIRLQALYWRPALGLHELALLPGLPRQPAASLSGQLGRQTIARILPPLAVMAGFGLAVDAPPAYYPLLFWISAACAFLLAGATLLSLHSRAGRIACATLMVLLTIAVIAAMAIGVRATQTPAWLQTAASIALLAGVVLYGAALARLKALPHPWLQN